MTEYTKKVWVRERIYDTDLQNIEDGIKNNANNIVQYGAGTPSATGAVGEDNCYYIDTSSSAANGWDIYYYDTTLSTPDWVLLDRAHDHTGDFSAIDYGDLINVPSNFTPETHATTHESGQGDGVDHNQLINYQFNEHLPRDDTAGFGNTNKVWSADRIKDLASGFNDTEASDNLRYSNGDVGSNTTGSRETLLTINSVGYYVGNAKVKFDLKSGSDGGAAVVLKIDGSSVNNWSTYDTTYSTYSWTGGVNSFGPNFELAGNIVSGGEGPDNDCKVTNLEVYFSPLSDVDKYTTSSYSYS